jgi:hypothetical protein
MRGLALALFAVALAAPAAGAGVARPTLALAGTQPLLVRGTHFAPNERIRLLVSGAKLKTLTVRASARGSFSLPLFAGYDRCHGLFVQALGAAGSRASTSVLTTGCEDVGDVPNAHTVS